MPSPFLTDEILWHLVCAARLAELDTAQPDPKHHADIAHRLQQDTRLGKLAATEAAEAYHATVQQRAA